MSGVEDEDQVEVEDEGRGSPRTGWPTRIAAPESARGAAAEGCRLALASGNCACSNTMMLLHRRLDLQQARNRPGAGCC